MFTFRVFIVVSVSLEGGLFYCCSALLSCVFIRYVGIIMLASCKWLVALRWP